MPTPSTQLALPQIAGADSPDIPRDINALIIALEANARYFTTRDVLATGIVGHNAAGRPLVLTDFTTDLGLSAPIGLYGCDGINDLSGSARSLTNKGAVPFTTGISGAASEAALMVGSTAQALYRADIGSAADPFRIETGTIACWFRSSKRATAQYLVTKSNAALTDRQFSLMLDTRNFATLLVGISGAPTVWQTGCYGVSDICDDRWHFIVGTIDGNRLRIFVDGAQEASVAVNGFMNGSAGPFNIGALGADGATASVGGTLTGKIDETFVSEDVLSEDQIRCLYSVKFAHAMTRTPRHSFINIRRRRRGATYAPADFPVTPRLHQLTAGALTEASGGTALTTNVGTGSIQPVAGASGVANNAYYFVGSHNGLSSSDASLPAALTVRSYGCWFKGGGQLAIATVMGWGTISTADARLSFNASDQITATSGADVITGPWLRDGEWHFIVVTEDNTGTDWKRKLYVDGQCVGGSAAMNTLTLAGANRYRIAAAPDGTLPCQCTVDAPFVVAAALTPEQILYLYARGDQSAGVSPKNPAPHIERMDATNLLFVGDSMDPQDQFDLGLVA